MKLNIKNTIMAKKDNFFLNIHKECIETGQLPVSGLCGTINCHEDTCKKYQDILSFVGPTIDDAVMLAKEGYNTMYWGYGIKHTKKVDFKGIVNIQYTYTPLRQTIILLCHEILNSKWYDKYF